MGYFSELDVLIQDRCTTTVKEADLFEGEIIVKKVFNENDYLQLRDEIGLHLSGELAFDQLSPIAQDVVRDWESLIEESTGGGKSAVNHAEADCGE